MEHFIKWILGFAIAVLISNFSMLAFSAIVVMYIILGEKESEIKKLEKQLENRRQIK